MQEVPLSSFSHLTGLFELTPTEPHETFLPSQLIQQTETSLISHIIALVTTVLLLNLVVNCLKLDNPQTYFRQQSFISFLSTK